MSGSAEPVDTEPGARPGHSKRTISNQACAQKRRRLVVVIAGRQAKAEPGVCDGVLGIPAVDLVPGEPSLTTQILPPHSTEGTLAARPSQPGNADAVARCERRDLRSDGFDAANDLVTGHHGDRRFRKVAVDDMQIRSANTAREHSDENLIRTQCGEIEINGLHLAGPGPGQRHRAHALRRRKASPEEAHELLPATYG
jgi:hypothetical protein